MPMFFSRGRGGIVQPGVSTPGACHGPPVFFSRGCGGIVQPGVSTPGAFMSPQGFGHANAIRFRSWG